MSSTLCALCLIFILVSGHVGAFSDDPFPCPEPDDCYSEECRHLDRSGLCDEVAIGNLEITIQNCGCCFLCSDRKPGEWFYKLLLFLSQ
ncbi:uncharacterized protein TNIN_217341 [Trichonephila inaurata madagascariensis]|uniref:Uncharacterized protein n=1 Tax=Trichonephila inaurata madagascariensis TaxID=2747483 RepID=A0A8X6XXF7_9ARAC|nr:uncharacterized protein TNIN_217341 [Trichonephila inaurata madagascariensis]